MLTIQQMMRAIRDLQERVQKLEIQSFNRDFPGVVAEFPPNEIRTLEKPRRGRPPKVVTPEPVTEI